MNTNTLAYFLKLSRIPDDVISDSSENLLAFELTYAEQILIYEGSLHGEAICHKPFIPTSLDPSSIPYLARYVSDKNTTLIRSEILEWLLYPTRAEKIFPKGKIRIFGATIDKHFAQNRSSKSAENNQTNQYTYSLNLAYTTIKLDLVFDNCIFPRGISLSNSTTKDIVFRACHIGFTAHKNIYQNLIKASVRADNMTTVGDFKISDVHEIQKEREDSSDNRNIVLNFKSSDINEGRKEDDYNRSFGNKSALATRVLNDIILENSKVSELVSLSFSELHGNVNMIELQANQVDLIGATVHGSVNSSRAQIKSTFQIEASNFFGDNEEETYLGYSLDLSDSNIGWVSIRNALVINGINMSTTESDYITIHYSVIFKNLRSLNALDINRTDTSRDIAISRGSVLLGRLELSDSKIGRNLQLSQSKFIGELDKQEKALGCDNIDIKGRITFCPPKYSIRTSEADLLRDSQLTISYSPGRAPILTKKREIIAHFTTLRRKHRTNLSEGYKKLNSDPATLEELSKQFMDACQDIYNHENLIYSIPMQQLATGYELLHTIMQNETEGRIDDDECQQKMFDTSIIVGESSFSGIKCHGQFDCSNAFFVGMNTLSNQFKPKKDEISRRERISRKMGMVIPRIHHEPHLNNYPNALTIKYSKISGDLFFNEGPDESPIPFRALGEVNLHSSKVDQFFVSTRRGEFEYTKWKLIGLKYDYIYSKNLDKDVSRKSRSLEQCNWFYDYHEENNRQPYEQLASVFLKTGEDGKARSILLSSYPRNIAEGIMLWILKVISRIGVPHYRALTILVTLIICSSLVFREAARNGGMIARSDVGIIENGALRNTDKIPFSPVQYSLQTALPFMNSDQKTLFSPRSPSGKSIVPDIRYTGLLDSGLWASAFVILNNVLGVILISMFIIGITRIIRRS
ncbi:hypothetical protein [Dyadobacter aurulentus]|uniref:hypothetical protein n=1 Tax=Dyadobacter sp. UC 10 TaxID=2605428 RepID=UPI0011F33CA7|nr:hypothetical protein [Dyadobacter sp. UC 10]KAA0988671.1 hypothetical protein FXO21_00065 [Dyadobacter sp. UC 10]